MATAAARRHPGESGCEVQIVWAAATPIERSPSWGQRDAHVPTPAGSGAIAALDWAQVQCDLELWEQEFADAQDIPRRCPCSAPRSLATDTMRRPPVSSVFHRPAGIRRLRARRPWPTQRSPPEFIVEIAGTLNRGGDDSRRLTPASGGDSHTAPSSKGLREDALASARSCHPRWHRHGPCASPRRCPSPTEKPQTP
jgi:hypothetical protein